MPKPLTDILSNEPLVCAILSWFIAQVLKILTTLITTHKVDIAVIVSSGGMPSSHSALVSSLATAVGLRKGLASTEFTITFVMAVIVMYDAIGVRREAGNHAQALNQIIKNFKIPLGQDEFKELLGHTPLQVLAGCCLGTGLAVGQYVLVSFGIA